MSPVASATPQDLPRNAVLGKNHQPHVVLPARSKNGLDLGQKLLIIRDADAFAQSIEVWLQPFGHLPVGGDERVAALRIEERILKRRAEIGDDRRMVGDLDDSDARIVWTHEFGTLAQPQRNAKRQVRLALPADVAACWAAFYLTGA